MGMRKAGSASFSLPLSEKACGESPRIKVRHSIAGSRYREDAFDIQNQPAAQSGALPAWMPPSGRASCAQIGGFWRISGYGLRENPSSFFTRAKRSEIRRR